MVRWGLTGLDLAKFSQAIYSFPHLTFLCVCKEHVNNFSAEALECFYCLEQFVGYKRSTDSTFQEEVPRPVHRLTPKIGCI